ncbi:ATP-binding protein [Mycolicibacterium vanbaalenii]|uniref:ATP-binding protein n=1 Tax=Mycolicibacterium vanbaalenii TaxID=110539 RepID=UPI003BAEE659
MDRPGAVAELRTAVAGFVRDHAAASGPWCVALSGGADSLALTAVAAALRPTTALIVDHGLQPGSARVAATARDQAMALGCVGAQVLCVEVGVGGGPEAAARAARYRWGVWVRGWVVAVVSAWCWGGGGWLACAAWVSWGGAVWRGWWWCWACVACFVSR